MEEENILLNRKQKQGFWSYPASETSQCCNAAQQKVVDYSSNNASFTTKALHAITTTEEPLADLVIPQPQLGSIDLRLTDIERAKLLFDIHTYAEEESQTERAEVVTCLGKQQLATPQLATSLSPDDRRGGHLNINNRQKENDFLKLEAIVIPTDPDFPKESLLPVGLKMLLCFYYSIYHDVPASKPISRKHNAQDKTSSEEGQARQGSPFNASQKKLESMSFPNFKASSVTLEHEKTNRMKKAVTSLHDGAAGEVKATTASSISMMNTEESFPFRWLSKEFEDRHYALCLQIRILNQMLPRCVNDMFETVAYKALLTKNGSLYEMLKMIERSVTAVFEYGQRTDSTNFRLYAKQFGPVEWSQGEQKRLEEGLVWYGKLKDPKQKWSSIAKYVGYGRTARECAQRFQECRSMVEEKFKDKTERFQTNHVGSLPPIVPTDSTSTTNEFNDVRLSTQERKEQISKSDVEDNSNNIHNNVIRLHNPLHIKLHDLDIKGIALFYLNIICLVLSCTRCNTPTEICLKAPIQLLSGSDINPDDDDDDNAVLRIHLDNNSKFITKKQICSKCSNELCVTLQVVPCFLTSPYIAALELTGCQIQHVLPTQYLMECAECSCALECRNVFTGSLRHLVCRECHAELHLKYDAIQFEGQTHMKAILNKRDIVPDIKRSSKDKFSFKLGTPLPAEGTCKHYKKSYRWLRFPCCGRAYPCDVCHDEQADHPHDWATRMICGHCSKEQVYSQKPCLCGASLTASHSTHWEGGKGCRDPTKMSRKDDKKYKLMKPKTRSQK